ncbi:HECT-domain-containing protein [Hesseltinella vesiculosa]|uniref:HECT-type E3 ubiquitin transferase n=1 Tax=Hesseltinella vesiculosa TaxID=101127 RepID=A0A1X2G4H0_9FUNG|nr:HECT-domain-containing protein [Hesseltinella vesiculosa]
MFSSKNDKKATFVEQKRQERQQREKQRQQQNAEQKRTAAAISVQRWWRHRAQPHLYWSYWDKQMGMFKAAPANHEAARLIAMYCFFSSCHPATSLPTPPPPPDQDRLINVCSLLSVPVATLLDTPSAPAYQSPQHRQKYLIFILCQCLYFICDIVSPGHCSPSPSTVPLTTLLQFLKPAAASLSSQKQLLEVTFELLRQARPNALQLAAYSRIDRLLKQLARPASSRDQKWIKSATLWLSSVTRLWMFPLEAGLPFLPQFGATILTIPMLATHLPPLLLTPVRQHAYSLLLLCTDSRWSDTFFNQQLDGNDWLFLLGNLITLFVPDATGRNAADIDDNCLGLLMDVVLRVQTACLPSWFSSRQHGSYRHYHPLFKWTSCSPPAVPLSPLVFEQVDRAQIALLWSPAFLDVVLRPILEWQSQPRMALTLASQRVFHLLYQLGQQFPVHWPTILTRLAFMPHLMPCLWHAMHQFGPQGQLAIYHQAAKHGLISVEKEPLIHVLKVFCEASSLVFLTLDDMDIFKEERPFTVKECIEMAGFLNMFFFSLLQKVGPKDELGKYYGVRRLLLQLYDLDSRHPFCPRDHWILVTSDAMAKKHPLLKLLMFNHGSTPSASQQVASSFLQQLRQGDAVPQQILQTMPHTISFCTRLAIFRDWIRLDKDAVQSSLLLPSYLIHIRRAYLLLDGFRALQKLPTSNWKGSIRIAFVNQLGMEEAGIDQGGPFKDFVTLLVNDVFHPETGLFSDTKDTHLLYPSNTSSLVHTNHLELFEFIGKVIGKAVYEGILLDCQFARFFLAKFLGRNVFLEALKELDEDVWKNLIFLKHYNGDAVDLGLTFATDEHLLGKIVTKELKHRGQDLTVTNDNKLEYVYLMADYKLNQQVRQQTEAFVQGFRSIISSSWVRMFTPSELQWIISGEDLDFDVPDLRRHTQYQNGYFEQHPIIKMLWQIVQEFTSHDKRAFLKFITGCPKPPLGGAQFFQPPFTIRMVSLDHQSVEGVQMMKAMFRLGSSQEKMGRLPSSSTCFNLLKLPAYTKKSVLREKLRYAIHSNAGFELS